MKLPPPVDLDQDVVHIDYETRASVSIDDYGSFAYAEHEDTSILMFAIAVNDDEPVLWDIFNTRGTNKKAIKIFKNAVKKGHRIYAHNYQFELAITQYTMARQFSKKQCVPMPDIMTWRCTSAMCRSVAIPHALDKASHFLGLGAEGEKDTDGKRLINKFSKWDPTKNDPHLPMHDPVTGKSNWDTADLRDKQDFIDFGDYCIQDVRVEQKIFNKLKYVDFDKPTQRHSLEAFQFDAVMNTTGIPVDMDTLKKVSVMVEEEKTRIREKFRKLVGLNPTQGQKFKAWLQERGYQGENMQAATVEKTLEQGYLKGEAAKALKLYALQSFAAISKINTMIMCANSDNRVRGTLLLFGAIRTRRWSGMKIQCQNMRRPTLKDVRNIGRGYMSKECARAYEWLKKGKSAKKIAKEWQCPFLEVVASVIRQFIQEPDGDVNNADYSSIEARLVPRIVNDEVALQEYRTGVCRYSKLGTKIFNKPYEVVKAEDGLERYIGKQGVLGCCYGVSAVGFIKMLDNYQFRMPDEAVDEYMENPTPVRRKVNGKMVDVVYKTRKSAELHLRKQLCAKTVKIYREENPLVKDAWKDAGAAAMQAIKNPNRVFSILNGNVKFVYNKKLGFPALRMRIPSGVDLTYPRPRIITEKRTFTDEDGEDYTREVETISFYGKLENGGAWGRTTTYGAKLIENVAQALCASVMAHGGVQALKKGYKIWMLVHDEAICAAKDGSIKGFTKALCKIPKYLPEFPLESDGQVCPYYTK